VARYTPDKGVELVLADFTLCVGRFDQLEDDVRAKLLGGVRGWRAMIAEAVEAVQQILIDDAQEFRFFHVFSFLWEALINAYTLIVGSRWEMLGGAEKIFENICSIQKRATGVARFRICC
jgi:hypothetical protein